MIEFIRSITEDEIEFISKLDYEQDSSEHAAALRKVIFEQSGKVLESQYWFPLEVLELGANDLISGHEREFTICTLLVLLNSPDEKYEKLESSASYYDQLPEEYRDLILQVLE